MVAKSLAAWVCGMSLAACEPAKEPAASSAGVLEGTVRLAGSDVPKPTHIDNTTDPEVCGEDQTLEDFVMSPSRGLANVIVSVRDAPVRASETQTLVLDNVDCRFVPHAAVVTVGSTVEARNSDAVLHTTHLYGPTEMNFSLPLKGTTASRTLTEPGMYVVKCDVHGWMQAFIRVDPHPFHAVTDSRGRFRIEGLPAGSYTLEVWHEKLGVVERDVRLEETTPAAIEVEYTP